MGSGLVLGFIRIDCHIEQFDLPGLKPGLRDRINPFFFVGRKRVPPWYPVGDRFDQLPGLATGHVFHRPPPEQVAARLVEIGKGVLIAGTKQLLAGSNGLCIKQIDTRQVRRPRHLATFQNRWQQIEGTGQRLTASWLDPARLPQHDRSSEATVVGGEF